MFANKVLKDLVYSDDNCGCGDDNNAFWSIDAEIVYEVHKNEQLAIINRTLKYVILC